MATRPWVTSASLHLLNSLQTPSTIVRTCDFATPQRHGNKLFKRPEYERTKSQKQTADEGKGSVLHT